MNLKNITLNTAELGPVKWEDIEKVQPNKDGYICLVSYTESTKTDDDGEPYNSLTGKYIQTYFDHKPNYKEIINFIIEQEYPNGKELQMLRLGVYDPDNEEYLEYFNNVEDITSEIKSLLNK